MTHVITQSCCNDAACVPACPVDCIHPTPGERAFASTEMLYIDPDSCIDCGACVDVCPVAAIAPDYELSDQELPFIELNARWYAEPRTEEQGNPTVPRSLEITEQPGPLRVAVVGTGPSGTYVAEELMSTRDLDVRVTMVERLLTPGGLVRFGVAPDHATTKKAGDLLNRTLRRPGVELRLGVELGTHTSVKELLGEHHAVIVAVGAASDRALDIPGVGLRGNHSATDLVGWYNGHPDVRDLEVDLSASDAVVVGNGNVALDVARILLSDPATLRRTDIADHALEQLAQSRIRTVTLLGRRGPDRAAFTAGELLGLEAMPNLAIDVRAADLAAATDGDEFTGRFKVERLRALAARRPEAERTLRLRFHTVPESVLGTDRVSGVRVHDQIDGIHDLSAGLLVRAVGYFGTPVPGLPFDEVTGTVPHVDGRVTDGHGGAPVVGAYVAGWIKRGPSGGIGANRWCARETVSSMLEDYVAGRLANPVPGELARHDQLPPGANAWKILDAHERAAGREASRPRVKLVDPEAQSKVLSAAI